MICTLNLKEKKLLVLTAAFVFISLLTLFPPVQYILINIVEQFLLHRQLQREIWLKSFFLNGLFFISFFVLLGFVVLKQITFSIFFVAVITLSFLFTNIIFIHNKDFMGYYNLWNYADLLEHIEYYAHASFFETNYPPLCIVFYRFLYLFFPKKGIDTVYILNYILFFYLTGTSLVAFCLFNSLININICIKKAIAFVLFITGPYLFAYQRANVTIIAFIGILFFLCFYSRQNKVLRELALFCLAVAANIKLFPAIFGAILLKERKWKAAVRVFIYSLVLFFLPHIISLSLHSITVDNLIGPQNELITGKESDAGTIAEFISSSSNFASGDWIMEYCISMKAFVFRILSKLRFSESMKQNISMICVSVCFILSLSSFFITRRKSYELLLLGFLCVFIPTSSFWYSLIYLIPGLIYYINEQNDCNYVSYFINIFLVLTFIFSSGFALLFTPHKMLHIILMWAVIIFDILATFIRCKLITEK